MAATPSAQYSLTIRVEIEHKPGMLGQVASAIGQAGGTIGSVDLVKADGAHTVRDSTVLLHVGGKIEQRNKVPLKTRDDLSMAYTPGVARVCAAIAEYYDRAFQ